MNVIHRPNKNNSVALIIPFYNAELTLKRTLASVANFLDSPFYVVCVDNMSTDGSLSVCAEYVPHILPGKILHCSVRGVSAARNIGLAEIYGCKWKFKYLTFLDADDYFCSEEPFKEDNSDLIVYSTENISDESSDLMGAEVLRRDIYSNRIIKPSDDFLLSGYIREPNANSEFVTVWGKFYKVDALSRAGLFFNERMHTFEDVDFNFRYLKLAGSISFRQSILVRHTISRTGGGATFSRQAPERLFGFLWAMRSLRSFMRQVSPKDASSYLHTVFAYFSIAIVRYGATVNSFSRFALFLVLIRKSVRSPILRKASVAYSAHAARGSRLVHWFYKRRLALLLIVFVIFKGKRRYGLLL